MNDPCAGGHDLRWVNTTTGTLRMCARCGLQAWASTAWDVDQVRAWNAKLLDAFRHAQRKAAR